MAAPAQPQQKKTLLMTEGSIWKSILLFSVPLILGNLLQQLYNTADSIIVGNFLGSNALAAVGSSGSPIYLLIGFSQGVAVGAGVVVSQYLGAKDKKETRIAVHTSLAIAVILGLILTVGGIAVSRSLLVWMNTPEEVLGDAVTYMKLYFGGVLFSVVYNMAAGILNAADVLKLSRCSTYLPIISVSRFTSSPGFLKPSVVSLAVCGISDTLKPLPVISVTVRLMPSMAMLPFFIIYFKSCGGVLTVTISAIPCAFLDIITPMPSTWPLTICPSSPSLNFKVRSRFTLSPLFKLRRLVSLTVSGIISAVKALPLSFTTVRQAPLTAMLSPILRFSKTFCAFTVIL